MTRKFRVIATRCSESLLINITHIELSLQSNPPGFIGHTRLAYASVMSPFLASKPQPHLLIFKTPHELKITAIKHSGLNL